MELPGFHQLLATCRRRQLRVELRPPSAPPADVEPALGATLDPQLAALYAITDGGHLEVLRLDAASELVPDNLSARRISDEPAYGHLVLYAQVGLQAAHLATVPPLAGDGGLQPVVYADFNEAPVITPIASTVDGAFALVAAYLERAADDDWLLFPHGVADLVAADAPLSMMIAAGRFAFIR